MKVLLIDIDGLRPDVFSAALGNGRLPNIERFLGGLQLAKGVQLPVLAPAPSITFCSQASLFTGAHPGQHGIPGNQFFDRFGSRNQGVPRHYAFDVGDTLAADDAVLVFTQGLASNCLCVPTLY
jgi:predicted AlkP superfamily pyrophosphatase or phosphodiesterase